MNVGFIGVGYMGYGIAKNILKETVYLLLQIKKEHLLIRCKWWSKEVKSYNELCEKNLDALFLCVTIHQ